MFVGLYSMKNNIPGIIGYDKFKYYISLKSGEFIENYEKMIFKKTMSDMIPCSDYTLNENFEHKKLDEDVY